MLVQSKPTDIMKCKRNTAEILFILEAYTYPLFASAEVAVSATLHTAGGNGA